MLPPEILEQVRRLRFDDPAVEATYYAERRDRDVSRTRRIAFTVVVVAIVIGLMVIAFADYVKVQPPVAWIVLRFGFIVPALIAMWLFGDYEWTKQRLQPLLAIALTVALSAHAIEWATEWTPDMPFRTLWLMPATMSWATLMSLPLNARYCTLVVIGVFTSAILGMIIIVPTLPWPVIFTMVAAYALGGRALVLLSSWREREWRLLYANHREAEQLAEKLRAQNETLTRLIRQRDEFAAGVLHDLRGPLTGIVFGTDMLRHSGDMSATERTTLVNEIDRSAKRVIAFANRFLEQSSLERAAAEPALAEVPLAPLVERAVAHARLSAGPKQQRIVLEDTSPAAVVVVDELLFDRALGNLLTNAVKYSPLGAAITVRVSAEITPKRARIAVIDRGPGLSTEEQAKLFQPFVVLNKKPTGGELSTGLGLSLVKLCVEKMGGAVGCESTPGQGATFWLTLRRT